MQHKRDQVIMNETHEVIYHYEIGFFVYYFNIPIPKGKGKSRAKYNKAQICKQSTNTSKCLIVQNS